MPTLDHARAASAGRVRLHASTALRCIALLGLPLASCLQAAPSPGDALAEVERLVGRASCTSDADCHTVGIGEKACGGPQRYLAWSSRVTDEKALVAAAARLAAQARAQAEASGIASTCSVVADPGAVCAAVASASANAASSVRECRLRPATPGASAV